MANKGHLPPIAAGKRVIVRLRNGSVCGREPVGNALPNGWAADGRFGCRWELTGSPFDIVGWEIAA
jgi:hypothetical protein